MDVKKSVRFVYFSQSNFIARNQFCIQKNVSFSPVIKFDRFSINQIKKANENSKISNMQG
jgi:hypothetical protein